MQAALGLLDSQDFDEPGVTTKDLQPLLKIDNSATYRRVQAAYPYLVPLDEKRGRAKQYGKGDELPRISKVLPSPDELCNFASESTPEGTGAKDEAANFASDEKRRAKFAQSSPDSRGMDEHKPFINGGYADTDTTEHHGTTRGSIGVQSCKVREDEPAKSPSLRKVSTNFASVLDAMRDYLEHEPLLHSRDRRNVDLWLWNLADNGYGDFPEEAIEEALHEYGDEILEEVR